LLKVEGKDSFKASAISVRRAKSFLGIGTSGIYKHPFEGKDEEECEDEPEDEEEDEDGDEDEEEEGEAEVEGLEAERA
jgi:hypothetical protein